MLNIIVRSRSDANAVKSMISSLYRDWSINVYTMHGARRESGMLSEIQSIVRDDEFYIVLVGREDEDVALKIASELPDNALIHVIPKARVRNARLEQLSREFDLARARIRASVYWIAEESSYIFSPRKHGVELESLMIDLTSDPYLVIGSVFSKVLSSTIGLDVPEASLIMRGPQGLHYIYTGPVLRALMVIPDSGDRVEVRVLNESFSEKASVNSLLSCNARIIKLYERVSLRFLSRFKDLFDNYIVTWSGGKDSTASLILAAKAFGARNISVIHVSTKLDFPESTSYVERLSKTLGLSVTRVEVDISKPILAGEKPLPTHDNRWCTEAKVKAIENIIARDFSGKTLVIVGDRDAESEARARRPFIRCVNERVCYAAPIRLWGSAHVQLYLLSEGVGLNDLYLKGFYRIGCYICPSLRSWEILVMKKTGILNELSNRRLLEMFLKSKNAL